MAENEQETQAHKLAKILQEMQDEETLFAEIRSQHKARMEALHNQAYTLKDEILHGQKSLPLEVA